MNIIKFSKGDVIARQKDNIKVWYIIQEGTVVQSNGLARLNLGKDEIIGLSVEERYLCNYTAGTDCVLEVYPFETPDDLKLLLNGSEDRRGRLIRAALNQRQTLLKTYHSYHTLVHRFHFFVENLYEEYTNFCMKYGQKSLNFPPIDNFKPPEITHRVENWEIRNSSTLMTEYLEEYLQLIQKHDDLSIGLMMEVSRQTIRTVQGIDEMMSYLAYHQDILLAESSDDIFNLYLDLLIHVDSANNDKKPLTDTMDRMADIISKLGIYDRDLTQQRILEYQDYKSHGSVKKEPRENVSEEDYLLHILSYARLDAAKTKEICSLIQKYRELPDMQATDKETSAIRKALSNLYYDIYYKVFKRAVDNEEELTPIVQMFLNFGFMDVKLIGQENANILYNLTEHLSICNSDHIYTIYSWLKSVYKGDNETSINEFDLDYPAHLAQLRKDGSITAAEAAEYAEDRDRRLQYEIQNMFVSGNRTTYGKISTFCPILCEYDLINSIDKMLVTVRKLEAALNQIRKIDYSVFFREVAFSDPQHGINVEPIQKEVLPDIILMPNAGTRAMMWQEIAGKKRDTPARFLFPILTAVDINDIMIEIVGRYRWEICRRIQGVHWNDFREKSLTSEYCDYVQFYRKNRDLSADAKEKIKIALQRGRNNFREVFVKDYQSWIMFESKGSYRLNKIARGILIRYCPFSKQIREELKANPIYQDVWQRHEMLSAKSRQRINALYLKYERAGGTVTPELKTNLEYYDM